MILKIVNEQVPNFKEVIVKLCITKGRIINFDILPIFMEC